MGQSLESPNAGLPAVLSHGVMVSINTSWQPCVIYTWSSDNQGSPSQSWYPEVDLIPRDPMPPPYSPEWLSSHQGNRHSCRTFPGLRDHLPGAKNKGQNKGIALLKKKKVFIYLAMLYLFIMQYLLCSLYLSSYIYLSSCSTWDLHCSMQNLSLWHTGFSVQFWPLDSWLHRSVVCSTWAQLPRGTWDLSSLSRDQTQVSCIGRWILNHWTTRETPRPLSG